MYSRCFTFAGAVGSSQHSTLVYAAKGLKQPSDVLIALLLSQHAHKQLPVLCETKDMHKKKKKDMRSTLVTSQAVNENTSIEATIFIHQGAVLATENGNKRGEWKECDLNVCLCVRIY